MCWCDIALADELHPASDPLPPPRTTTTGRRGSTCGATRRGVGRRCHLDLLASFNYTTILLGEARRRGLLPLEQAVHLLTDAPARLYGLVRGRGRARLARRPRGARPGDGGERRGGDALRPAGRGRPAQRPRGHGYRPRVLVNGRPTASGGVITGETRGSGALLLGP